MSPAIVRSTFFVVALVALALDPTLAPAEGPIGSCGALTYAPAGPLGCSRIPGSACTDLSQAGPIAPGPGSCGRIRTETGDLLPCGRPTAGDDC